MRPEPIGRTGTRAKQRTRSLVVTLAAIESALRERDLTPRGAFHPNSDDDLPTLQGNRPVQTLVLAGNVGPLMWNAFTASPPQGEHPLDAWSKELLEPLAAELGAGVVFPGDGPPYWPFQRWAMAAEPLHPSPLGILIHPDYGLWHGYRGALLFAEQLDLPPPDMRSSPCENCADKPCLSSCPVGAFAPERYDVGACVGHLETPLGADCREFGCRARLACPITREYAYEPGQARFHMAAFLHARRQRAGN